MTIGNNYWPSLNEFTNAINEMFRKGYISEDEAFNRLHKIYSKDMYIDEQDRRIYFNDRPNISTYVSDGPSVSTPVPMVDPSPIDKKKSFKKSNKQRKNKVNNENNITDKNIDLYIEKYLKKHPEIVGDYIKKNIKIDFQKVTTTNGEPRFALALFDDGKLISRSTLGLNIMY